MLQLIRKWLGLCQHKWTIISTADIYAPNSYSLSGGNKLPFARDYIMQCNICGNLKNKRL